MDRFFTRHSRPHQPNYCTYIRYVTYVALYVPLLCDMYDRGEKPIHLALSSSNSPAFQHIKLIQLSQSIENFMSGHQNINFFSNQLQQRTKRNIDEKSIFRKNFHLLWISLITSAGLSFVNKIILDRNSLNSNELQNFKKFFIFIKYPQR